MIAVLLILFAFSFMHFLDNPEEATEMDGDERNEAAKNPLYIIGGIAMVILGYIMANKGSNKGFNGQYT